MLKITNHAGSHAPANGNFSVIDSMVLIVGGLFSSLGFGWKISDTRQMWENKIESSRPTRMEFFVLYSKY